jgi:phosphoserine phosphatase
MRNAADGATLARRSSGDAALKIRQKVLAVVLVSVAGCASVPSPTPAADPLPAWNPGPAKQRIIDFVAAVTTPGAAAFVPVTERIAVFDNDGTLWSERPLYFPIAFVIDRIRTMAPDHPEWRKLPAVKAILSGDPKALAAVSERDLMSVAALAETGMTQEDYRRGADEWLAQARHPKRDRRYEELVYVPMLELLAYLRAHQFKTFVVTGGFVDFTRELANDVYGIPPDQVIGTRWKLQYDAKANVVMRLPELESFNNEETKVTNIEALIGARPLVAVGNSDGDAAMMTYTDERPGESLEVLVYHDDAAREYQYDAGAKRVLEEAFARKWVVVSIRKDFKKVYPFD